MNNICVLGDGAWGCAFALMLKKNGHNVKLWCQNTNIANEINEHKTNNVYLPNINLGEIYASSCLKECLDNVDFVFEAIPVKYLNIVLSSIVNLNIGIKNLIILSKGIDANNLKFPTEIAQSYFKKINIAIISGPSFAYNVCQEEKTICSISSTNQNYAKHITNVVNNNYFKCKPNSDIFGTQICSTVKNIMALTTALLTSTNYQENCIAAALNKLIEETKTIIKAYNGNIETITEPCGFADMFLTCTSTKSKNYSLGIKIGQKMINKEQLNTLDQESLNSLKAFVSLEEKLNIELPLIKTIYQYIFHSNGQIKDILNII